jgi:hypothetical protein
MSLAMYEVFNPTLLLAFFQFKKIGPMQMQISFKYKIVSKFIHVLPMRQYPCLMLDWDVVGLLQVLVGVHHHVNLFKKSRL